MRKPCKRGHFDGRDADGHCIVCRRASNTKSYQKASEKIKVTKRASTRAWEARNPDAVKGYRWSNELRRIAGRQFPLTDEQKAEMRNIYANCPDGYHVDHVHPLCGQNFSGLHVPWNLQYLPALDNLKKGNKLPWE